MEVNKVNTQTIIANLRAEGQQSRAEYVELLALRIEELEAAQQGMHTDGACTCAEPNLYSDGGAEVFCRSCGKPPRW